MIRIDRASWRVWHGERELRLTPIQFRLLDTLVTNAGRVITREHLARQVWGCADYHTLRTLTMHIASLRGKLGDDAHAPKVITTIRGVGYRLEAHAVSALEGGGLAGAVAALRGISDELTALAATAGAQAAALEDLIRGDGGHGR